MLGLESYLDSYEDLELIRRLKELVSSYVSSDEPSTTADGTENSVSVHNLRNGLGPVRRTFMAELSDHLSGVTQEQILGNTKMSDAFGKKHQKKQKSGSLFDSFNFDDLVTLEPLGDTTAPAPRLLLDIALSKLMSMDVGELIEHPQWFELLTLLWKSLVADRGAGQSAFPTVALHVRLMHAMSGQQCLDIVNNLLKYLWQQWGAPWRGKARVVDVSAGKADPASVLSVSDKREVATLHFALCSCQKHLEHSTE